MKLVMMVVVMVAYTAFKMLAATKTCSVIYVK